MWGGVRKVLVRLAHHGVISMQEAGNVTLYSLNRRHPLVIALAVTLGGAIAGFLRVLLAVPVTAAGAVALSELWAAGYLGHVDT